MRGCALEVREARTMPRLPGNLEALLALRRLGGGRRHRAGLQGLLRRRGGRGLRLVRAGAEQTQQVGEQNGDKDVLFHGMSWSG